jgi:hypothetical protein
MVAGVNFGPFISSLIASFWPMMVRFVPRLVEGVINAARNCIDRAAVRNQPDGRTSREEVGASSPSTSGAANGGIHLTATTTTTTTQPLELSQHFDDAGKFNDKRTGPETSSSGHSQPVQRESNQSLGVMFDEQSAKTQNSKMNNIVDRNDTDGSVIATPDPRGQAQSPYYHGLSSVYTGNKSFIKHPVNNNVGGTQQHSSSFSVAMPYRQPTPHPNAAVRKRPLNSDGDRKHVLFDTPMTMDGTTENSVTPKYRRTSLNRRDTPRYVPLSPFRNADIDTKTSFSSQLRKRRADDTVDSQQKQLCDSIDQLQKSETEQTPSKRRRLNVGGRVPLHGSRTMTGMVMIGSHTAGNNGTRLNRLAIAAASTRRSGFLRTTSRNTVAQSGWLSSSSAPSRPAAKRERHERDRKLWEQLNRVEEKPKDHSSQVLSSSIPTAKSTSFSAPTFSKAIEERTDLSTAQADPGPGNVAVAPAFSFIGSGNAATQSATTVSLLTPSLSAGGRSSIQSSSQVGSDSNAAKPFVFGQSSDVEKNETENSNDSTKPQAHGPTFGTFTTAAVFGTDASSVLQSTPAGSTLNTIQAVGLTGIPTIGRSTHPEQPMAQEGNKSLFGGSSSTSLTTSTFATNTTSNVTSNNTTTSQLFGETSTGDDAGSNSFGTSTTSAVATNAGIRSSNRFGTNVAGSDKPSGPEMSFGSSTASSIASNPFGVPDNGSEVSAKFGSSASVLPGGNTNPFSTSSAQTSSGSLTTTNGSGGQFNGTNQVNGLNATNFASTQISGNTTGMKPFSAMSGTENNPFVATTVGVALAAHHNPMMPPNGFSVVATGGGEGAGARRRQKGGRTRRR